jgi:hypothetical protein
MDMNCAGPDSGSVHGEIMDTVRCGKCTQYHRKVQKLESEIIKLKKQLDKSRVDPWASESRKAEAMERDAMANVIEQFSKPNELSLPYGEWKEERYPDD